MHWIGQVKHGGQVKQTRLDNGCKEEGGNWNGHCTGWMKQSLYMVDETVIVQGGRNSHCTGWVDPGRKIPCCTKEIAHLAGWNSYCSGGWQSWNRVDETVIVQVDDTVMKQGGWNSYWTITVSLFRWMKQSWNRVDETSIVHSGRDSHCTRWVKQSLYTVGETVIVHGGWNSHCTGWVKQSLYTVGETVIVHGGWNSRYTQGGWNGHCTEWGSHFMCRMSEAISINWSG